jgi:hypothetical protein
MLEILFQINIFVELIKRMMTNKNKVIAGLIFSILLSMFSFSSCDPHRRGYTASQIGAKSGSKQHRTPATAKRKYKSRY